MKSNEFILRVDFVKGRNEASKVFECIASSINALSYFDNKFIEQFYNKTDCFIALDDIEKGSIKAFLRNIISDIPDETLRSGEIKKIIGHFLVVAKYKLCEWLSDEEPINSNRLKELQESINLSASQIGVDQVVGYQPISSAELVQVIIKLTKATYTLSDGDQLYYQSKSGEVTMPTKRNISQEEIETLLISSTKTSETEAVLKVKKPDYLGNSKWNFRWNDSSIDAKIESKEWLSSFQQGEVAVLPGDSLKAVVKTHTTTDIHDQVIKIEFAISEVLEVLTPVRYINHTLDI